MKLLKELYELYKLIRLANLSSIGVNERIEHPFTGESLDLVKCEEVKLKAKTSLIHIVNQLCNFYNNRN